MIGVEDAKRTQVLPRSMECGFESSVVGGDGGDPTVPLAQPADRNRVLHGLSTHMTRVQSLSIDNDTNNEADRPRLIRFEDQIPPHHRLSNSVGRNRRPDHTGVDAALDIAP